MSNDNEIRPFRLDTSEDAIADLRRRLAATRWPTKSWSRIGRRVCSWRRCGSSPATGD